MMDIFIPGELDSISERYGAEFLVKLLRDIDAYSSKWGLSELRFVPYYSVNCVFTGISASYGDIVMKIGKPSKETITECRTLSEYKGGRFCRLYEAEPENGAVLEERIVPGNQLREEASPEKRLYVFCSVFTGLHREAVDRSVYPTYLDWVHNASNDMRTRSGCGELLAYMLQARNICEDLSRRYPKQLLLHGDLHHDNILLAEDGRYRLIDPKGVIGDPVFDIGRFILNEPYEESGDPEDAVHQIIEGLSQRLGIPALVIMQGFFIEITMGECWSVQDGLTPEEYTRRLGNVAFVKGLLDEMTKARSAR